MTSEPQTKGGQGGPTLLNPETLERILEVTRKLAAPFDLDTMLNEVIDAAKDVLDADSGTVWLYDADAHELLMSVATDIDPVRVSADSGLVGECASSRKIINVTDCYSDPRFNPDVDRESGYRTRCMLTLPLIGYGDSLVGVLQMLNKHDGVFGEQDETVAAALAAQCAVALQRVQMTEQLVVSEKLNQEIAAARQIQLDTLPKGMPAFPGYDLHGLFQPADATGGDTYDLVAIDEEQLFILMGDATGHGFGPALCATQMQAMLRVSLRLGADLDTAFKHVNDQLAEDLPDDRFITAFLGFLDAQQHKVEYHSGGQGPILHYRASSRGCEWHEPSSFPMGVMPHVKPAESRSLLLEPGDMLGLISDGIYEYEGPDGAQFGETGVSEVVEAFQSRPMSELAEELMARVIAFGGDLPQADDITIVLIKRLPA